MTPSSQPQIPRFLLGFTLALVVLGAAECGAEATESQLIPDMRVVHAPHDVTQVNPFVLWEPEPGLTEEAGVRVEINDMGMRGPKLSTSKSPRERRVMVLGDGVAFGQGVPEHRTLGQVAVDRLGGDRIGLKHINAGVVDYSLRQSQNLMELRGWSLLPDVLVVVPGVTDRAVGPHCDEEVIPLVRPAGYQPWLAEHSALYRVLDYTVAVRHGRHHRRYQQIVSQSEAAVAQDCPRLSPQGVQQSLEDLIGRSRSLGVRVVVLIAPLPEDLAGGASDQVAAYRSVTTQTAVRAGVSVVDGVAAFEQTGRDAAELWLDEAHPTEFGHRVLGRALASALSEWIRGDAGRSR